MHKTLLRQVNKHFGSEDRIPPELAPLFQVISDTYQHADEDRALIERSLDISSRELGDLNLELQAERDRATAIILSIVDGLIVVKKDDTIELINPQAESMLGWEKGSSIGKNVYELGSLYNGDTPVSHEDDFLTKTLTTGEITTSSLEDNYYVHAHSDKIFPVVVTVAPLMQPGTQEVYGAIIIFRDVSKEKQQHDLIEQEVEKRNQELYAERNRIALTLSSISDAVITLDLEDRILLFNKAAEILIEKSAKEVLGKNISDIIRVYENGEEVTKDMYSPHKDDNHDTILYNSQSAKIVCDGKEKYVHFISGRIADAEKVNIGSIITLHDLSKERQLEDMKIDFVSMAAHELRTPLTAIRGYATILKSQLDEKISDEQKDFLNRMILSIENLANLINNLLNVSRIERNSLKLEMSIIKLDVIVERTVEELKNTAQTKKQTLTFIKDQDQFPPILADHFKMGEVITNLIANAINYTSPGGEITVRMYQKDANLTVSVTDTGEGIPQEALPQLFSKFFRVSGKLEQGSKGTGLGLYISKSIVEMHKGTIGVESELGKGSVFHFSIPVATEQEIIDNTKNSISKTQKYGMVINEERRRNRINNLPS